MLFVFGSKYGQFNGPPKFIIRLVKEAVVHGSRHRRKHPKGRRKVGRKKRRLLRRRRAARTNGK